MKNIPIILFFAFVSCQPQTPKPGDIYEHLLTQQRYKVDIYGVDTLRNLYAQNPSMVKRILLGDLDTTNVSFQNLMSSRFVVLIPGESLYPTKMELLSALQRDYRKISP